MARKTIPFPEWVARDTYLTPDELELRRLAELAQQCADWEEQPHDLGIREALADLAEIVPLAWSGLFSEPYEGHPLDESPENRARLRSCVHDARHLLATDDNLTSFEIARGIVTGVVGDGGTVYLRDILLRNLAREEADWEKSRTEKTLMGRLIPETDCLHRVAPFVDVMKQRWREEGSPVLIGGMIVVGSGSGQIKPYHVNPDDLPADFRNADDDASEPFDPYAMDDIKEQWRGTTVATITTYAIAFRPLSPDQLPALNRVVQRALRVLAVLPPTFRIPVDYEARPYERPFFPATTTLNAADGIAREAWKSPEHCGTMMDDGQVKVLTRLDLDDTMRLYALLEPYIQPNAKIAQNLDAARYAEARSAPQQRSDLDRPYTTDYMDPDVQEGNLSDRNNAGIGDALRCAFALYYGGQTDDQGLVAQAIAIAGLSLSGILQDPSGRLSLPPLPRESRDLTPLAQEQAQLPLQQALEQRARLFLNLIAGQSPEATGPSTAQVLWQSRTRRGDAVKKVWRRGIRSQWEALFGYKGFGTARIDDLLGAPETSPSGAPDDDRVQQRWGQLAPRVGLVVRDPGVPPCVDRTYSGTIYTSRLGGSLVPRVALPAALRKFVTPEAAAPVFTALSHESPRSTESKTGTRHDPPSPRHA